MVKLLSLCAVLVVMACGTTSGITPFRGEDIGGKPFDLAPHLGKDVVVVSFWATFCEPCKAEMPYLQTFHEKYAKDGLAVVSVSIDGPDTEAGVAPYIRKQGYTFPVVIDRDGSIVQSLNPTATAPFLVVIGRDGKVEKKVAGFQPSEAAGLEQELARLLAQSTSTQPRP